MMLKKSPALAGGVEKRTTKETVNHIAKLRPPIGSPADDAPPLIRQTSI
jgi:hypothetical protein